MQEFSGRTSFPSGMEFFERHPAVPPVYDSASCSRRTNHLQSDDESPYTASRKMTDGYFEEPFEILTAEWKSSVSNPSQYAMYSSQFSGKEVTSHGYNDPHYNSTYTSSHQPSDGIEVRSNCSNWVSSYSSNMAACDVSYPHLAIFPLPVSTYRRVSQNSALPKSPQKYDLRIPLQKSQLTDAKNSKGSSYCTVRSRKNSSKRLSKGKSQPTQMTMSRLVKSVTSHPFHGVGAEFVFVWDLDETIIIFNSLLDGSFAQKFGTDLSYGLSLALKIEELVFFLAEAHFFLRDLNGFDQVHVDDASSADNGEDLREYNFFLDGFRSSVSSYSSNSNHPSSNPLPPPHGHTQVPPGTIDWMRKLAFRYRKIKDTYNIHRHDIGVLLGPLREQELHQLRANIDRLTGGWLSVANRSLTIINSRSNCINVLVTTTHLVPTLAKVLLFGLGEIFQVTNVYNAAKVGKVQCFEQITARFGRKCTYLVIGDGYEEEMSAKQRCWPFWRISNLSDLYSFKHAVDLGYL